MGKYCPGCGSEVREGSKFCQSCGAQIQTETNSSSFEDQVAHSPTKQAPHKQIPPQTPAPPPQQQTGQTQAYAPNLPKKSNKALIAGIVAIVVVLVIIGIIYSLFAGGVLDNILGGSDSRFVGEWEQESEYITISWIFNSDGSFESMGYEVGTWRVNSDQLCIKNSELWGNTEMCYSFEFSNNGNTLTLSSNGFEFVKLIKK